MALLSTFLCIVLALTAHHSLADADVASAGVREVIQLDDGTDVLIQEFPGASKWAIAKHIFTSSTVIVQCPDTHVGSRVLSSCGKRELGCVPTPN